MRKQKRSFWSRFGVSLLTLVLSVAAVGFTIAAARNRAQAAEIMAQHKPVQVADTTPLTAVAVTQCNQLVVLYITTAEGKLVKFDKSGGLPLDRVLAIGQSAKQKERVEVNCDQGSIGAGLNRDESDGVLPKVPVRQLAEANEHPKLPVRQLAEANEHPKLPVLA